MRRRIALIILLTIAVLLCASGQGQERVIHVGIAGFDFAPSIVARDILDEAYASIGCRAQYDAFPPNRMIASLVEGKIDAMAIAEARVSDEHPGIIRIETPIWIDEIVAFSRSPLAILEWDDLKGLKIGYIAAMFIIEDHLASGFDVYPVQDTVQMFRMLEIGRTDVVITSRTIGMLMIQKMGIEGISCASLPLQRVYTYHFLSERNADVAKRLSAELAEMDRTGRIAALTEYRLKKLFP